LVITERSDRRVIDVPIAELKQAWKSPLAWD